MFYTGWEVMDERNPVEVSCGRSQKPSVLAEKEVHSCGEEDTVTSL